MQEENLDILGLKEEEEEVNDNQHRGAEVNKAQKIGKKKEAEGFVGGTFVKTR